MCGLGFFFCIFALLLMPALGAARPLTPAEDTATSNPLRLAAAALGEELEKLQPDPFRTMLGALRNDAPPLAIRVLADPLNAAYAVGMVEETLRDEAVSPHRLLISAAGLSGASIARGYIGNPLQRRDAQLREPGDALARAIAAIQELDGAAMPPIPDVQALPEPLRSEIARIAFAFANAERFRRDALAPLALPDAEGLVRAAVGKGTPDPARDYRLAADKLERPYLLAGMLELAMALEDFTAWLKGKPALPGAVHVDITTALGRFVVDTRAADSEHESAPGATLAFVFDARGNDRYRDRTAPNAAARTCVIVDAQGNDRYDGEEGGGFARGLLGYGIVWDLEGDDEYGGALVGSAGALFGGALLVDEGGNDRHRHAVASQGYAFAGAAVLLDLGGDDEYMALTHSQACGAPRGGAVLMDLGGDDAYTLADDPLIQPAAQMPERNTSAGQGCGIGIRAELSDGRTLPGGVGLLIDAAGNDRYRASVYAQGAGYLEGLGALVDHAGNDVYEGGYYVQGAAAHRAAGVLIDRGGNDSYGCEVSASLGAAVDSSTAVLVDEGGDDRYRATGQALGSAFENGVALFVDAAGNDDYSVEAGAMFGVSEIHHWGSAREASLGLGLFFDLGGADRYPAQGRARENAVWAGPRRFPEWKLRSEYGAGVDGEFASPFFTGARTPRNESAAQLREETWRQRRAWRER